MKLKIWLTHDEMFQPVVLRIGNYSTKNNMLKRKHSQLVGNMRCIYKSAE